MKDRNNNEIWVEDNDRNIEKSTSKNEKDSEGVSFKLISFVVVCVLVISSIGFLLYDLDGDGVSNFKELTTDGINPLNKDSNGDGIHDGMVKRYGLDKDESYPENFVNVLNMLEGSGTEVGQKSAKEVGRERAQQMVDCILDDGEISEDENSILGGISKLDDDVAVNLAGSFGYDLNKTDRENARTIIQLLEKYPGASDKINSWYLESNDSSAGPLEPVKIEPVERKQLRLLNDDSYSFGEDFLSESGDLEYSEVKALEAIAQANGTDFPGFDNIVEMTDDGDLNTNDVRYIKMLTGTDPTNVNPQRAILDPHEDGTVTDEEIKMMRDGDNDGAIYVLEKKAGTDPDRADTDRDGVADGPEIVGGYQLTSILDTYGNVKYGKNDPANISWRDPLHKDAHIILINRYGEENFTMDMVGDQVDQLKQLYRDGPVSNPDGEDGINLKISYYKEEEFPEEARIHPEEGAAYFGQIRERQNLGLVPGNRFRISGSASEDFFTLVAHEFGHNILGELNNESIHCGDDVFHSNSRQHIMYPVCTGQEDYLPQVWNDLEEDGLLGLGSLGNEWGGRIISCPAYNFGGEERVEELLED